MHLILEMKEMLSALALILALDEKAAGQEKNINDLDNQMKQGTEEMLKEEFKIKVDPMTSFFGTKEVRIFYKHTIAPDEEQFTYIIINESKRLELITAWHRHFEYGSELKRMLVPREEIAGEKLEGIIKQAADGNANKIFDSNWSSFYYIGDGDVCDVPMKQLYIMQERIGKNYKYLKKHGVQIDKGMVLAPNEELKARLIEEDEYFNALMKLIDEKAVTPKYKKEKQD